MTSDRSQVQIELHADDYGESVHTSEDILELMKAGCLDGISILTNMHCFEETSRMLLEAVPELPYVPYLSVHVDVVEGRSLIPGPAPGGDTSSETGIWMSPVLPWNWKKLFCLSYHIPARDLAGKPMRYGETQTRITGEVRQQIRRGWELILEVYALADEHGIPCKSKGLRIDSHQHAHLIPVVWEALMQVVAEGSPEIEYIRTAHEPFGVFFKHLGQAWNPIGFVKNRILAVHAPKVEKYILGHGLKPAYMWGLLMSGHMDMDRVEAIMPDMMRKCARKGYDLEINIHPGRMTASETNDEIPRESAETFYLSDNRCMEAQTVRAFHDRMREYYSITEGT